MSGTGKIAFIIVAAFATAALFARSPLRPDVPQAGGGDDKDSLVSLLSAQKMELIEDHGIAYRKVTGPARFFHNNTYLLCDTALWNVSTNIIKAEGHVKILQNDTQLTGDSLLYFVDQNLAQFRGSVVQLSDKEGNTLRTRFLDYNTKDSVATFMNGGAFRDKDGQVIESTSGNYDSKVKTFTFRSQVNMFTDSIFVRARLLDYNTASGMATFYQDTDAWQDDKMLSANGGWYDRGRDLFLFTRNVHGLAPGREGWADSLYFNKTTRDMDLLGNVCLVDSARNTTAMAGSIHYVDSLSWVRMTRDPAALIVTARDSAAVDSVWVGADTLDYQLYMKFQIDSSEFSDAEERLSVMSNDAVSTYRIEAAKAAAEAAQKELESTDEYKEKKAAEEARARAEAAKKEKEVVQEVPTPAADTLETVADTVETVADTMETVADTLRNVADTLAIADSVAVTDSIATAPKDSTKLGFATGKGNVRLFRSDFQLACDSLRYNDIDSLVRLYKSPVVWNAGNRQYLADSIWVSFHEGGRAMDKAYLMSNAFISVQEQADSSDHGSGLFDQIRSTEMLAYFDTTSALSRFDALGEVNTVFYLKEDSVIATVNKSTAKMMMALVKDNDLQSVSYFDESNNDAYPLAQLPQRDRILKGFEWLPDRRPNGPSDVTAFVPRQSQRAEYEAHPRTVFNQTNIYFPGYMDGIYKEIEEGKARKAHARAVKDSLAAVDTVAAAVQVPDSVSSATPESVMSVRAESAADTLADTVSVAAADSLPGTGSGTELSARELRRQQQEAERKARIAAKEAKWARLDSLDAAKAQAKADRKQAKIRARKAKMILRQHEQERKDAARLEKYRERYQRQKDRRSR